MTPLVKDAEGDLPEVVLSRIAGRAPSSDSDDEVSVFSFQLIGWRQRALLVCVAPEVYVTVSARMIM